MGVSALASMGNKQLSVLLWHYHDDDVAGPAAAVTLNVDGLPAIAEGSVRVTHYRVDESHSNAYTVWKRMGSPQEPTCQQYAELEAASRLEALSDPKDFPIEDRAVQLAFALPRAGVSLVTIEWSTDPVEPEPSSAAK